MNKFIYWSPRLLSILLAAFLSIFSADVFGQYQGWQLLLALFMHLLPEFVTLAVAIIAWRYDLVGVIFFFGAAIFYIWITKLEQHWSAYAIISGSAIIIAVLYFLSWRQKKTVTSLAPPLPPTER